MNDTQLQSNRHYRLVAKAIEYLSQNHTAQPSLAELSSYVGFSEYHMQRVFSEWAGVSPKQFLQYLTKEHVKQILKHNTVNESALSAGLSGSGRLYDLMVTCEGMTPGEYKNSGNELTINYGIHDSPFGLCLIAITDKGICKLAFFDNETEKECLLDELHQEWDKATIKHDDAKTESTIKMLFARNMDQQKPLHLLLKGTKFQLKVWDALLSIPSGNLAAYQHIATSIGSPKSVRAVASAIARNNIAYLIPCHRVIRQNGEFSQYKWNPQRKQAIIAWEACKILNQNNN